MATAKDLLMAAGWASAAEPLAKCAEKPDPSQSPRVNFVASSQWGTCLHAMAKRWM